MFGFECFWGFVAERLVEPLAIVKHFDVLEHAQTCRVEVFVRFVLRPFVLERPEEPLGYRVVVAVAPAAHRALDAEGSQRLLVIVARVLRAAVAVMKQLTSTRLS